MSIVGFSTSVTTSSAFITLASNGKPNVDAVIDQVYGVAASGSTNWDAAFRSAATVAGDVVVTITDGNPTVRGVPTVGDGGDTDVWDVEQGVISANNVKVAGATSIAIGVGSNVSTTNLDLIASPDQSYLANNFSVVTDLLKAIAEQSCGGSITVNKKVKVGNGYEAATQPTYPAFTFEAVNDTAPPAVTPAGPTPTDANGAVSFSWNSTQNEMITVTEAPPNQSGYTQNSALTECKKSNGDPGHDGARSGRRHRAGHRSDRHRELHVLRRPGADFVDPGRQEHSNALRWSVRILAERWADLEAAGADHHGSSGRGHAVHALRLRSQGWRQERTR